MQSGLLRYGHNTDAPQFRMSHAKNQAHRLSTGDFVCNVDADNFTGPRFAQYLANIFREEPNALVDPSLRIKRSVGGGLYGRVALSRENFMNLGGYDEGFKGWGGEEVDMIHRAKGLGIRNYYIDDEFRLRVIQHSDEERVVNMFSDETDRAREVSKIFQIHHDARNIFVRRWDRVANIFGAMARGTQVNNGEFGMGRLLVGPQEVPMVLGPVDVDPSMNKRTGLGYPLESFIARWKPETRTVISVPGEGHEGEAFLPGHFAHS
jgi:hypothetical protein